jgi:thymidylate synthase
MANQEEQNYLDLMKKILDDGVERPDRTGTGTKSIFGTQLRFSLEDGKIPMLTTKKVFAKGVIEELLFFIRGETDTKKLEAKGVNIWKGNTSRQFLDSRGLHHYAEGETGPMYGAQWRNFNGVDQLSNALELLKKDPTSRRIMITAYNPSVSSQCVLDPCHIMINMYVANGKLSLSFLMRSTDYLLGAPFNLMSYAVLCHLMARASGLEAGELVFSGCDTHVYLNHIDQCNEQMSREPFEFPTLNIKKEIKSIHDMENLSFDDFEIIGYQHHAPIKAIMAV